MAYDIQINFSGSAAYGAVFEQAAQAWEAIITSDFNVFADLVIDTSVRNIDGSGGTIARAGGDTYDNISGSRRLADTGTMEFDSADIAAMLGDGTLLTTALHEIGHILGLGDRWETFGLVNASSYVGRYALAEYRILSGDAAATAVPLEAYGGDGTAYVHWREEIFQTEILTGFSEAGGIPQELSRLTIAALRDLGYGVDFTTADAYLLPPPPSPGPPVVLAGKKKADALDGGSGGDQLFGKKGDDNLYGYAGDDLLFCGKGADYADGGFGNDQVYGGKGNDRLFGDFGDDYVDGGKGGDTLNGEDGRDTVLGGKGADRVGGGTGDDVLYGGKGEDTFFFGNATGIDLVGDFRLGKDRLELDIRGINDFGDIFARLTQGANGATITFGTDQIILAGINAFDLSAPDVIFV